MTHRDRWEQYCSDVRENPDEALPFDEFLTEDLAKLSVTLASRHPAAPRKTGIQIRRVR